MNNNSNFGPIIENAIDADIATITEIYAEAVKFGKASFEWQAPD
jgi:L-amino acid N-acyltransferase YncA